MSDDNIDVSVVPDVSDVSVVPDVSDVSVVPDGLDEAADHEDTVEGVLAPAMEVSSPTGGSEVAGVPAAAPGDVLVERYRLEQELASRGGTLTWRAFDIKLSRSVLVHLLASGDRRNDEVLEAARKAATATDSRFLRVLDAAAGQDGSPSLVVCEFAPGESLERLLRQGPLSALEAAWMVRELADVMSTMHAEGLFHQRLNPDTVVISATGNVKIVGFLIEAALHPDDEQGTLAWSEREQADVVALGKILYASLVTRWPDDGEAVVDQDGRPLRRWGMPAAPFDNRGWLTPRQIRSGVSPALDVICDQVLSDAPRQNEAPIRTMAQLVAALNRVLGTADASPDLERRLRFPVQSPVELDPQQLDDTGRIDPDAPTMQFATVGAAPAAVAAPRPLADLPEVADRAGDEASSPVLVRSRPRPTNRRWLWLLLGLAMVVLLVSIIRVGLSHPSKDDGGNPSGPAVVKPVRAIAFDPVADGGDGKENSDDAGLAIDGDAKTYWSTEVYFSNPKMGGRKPGAGLLLDLGEKRLVSEVVVTFAKPGAGVELRIPEDAGTSQAPTNSVKSWTRLAAKSNVGTSVTLGGESTVETRYLLVYVNSLPALEAKKFRADIVQVEVHG